MNELKYKDDFSDISEQKMYLYPIVVTYFKLFQFVLGHPPLY